MSKLKIKNGTTWEEIPAGGVGVPSGGTAGQVLMKSSNTDYADEWHTLTPDDIGAMSTWELLWTNASPSSNFAEQTVSVSNISAYDIIWIDFYQNAPSVLFNANSRNLVTVMEVAWKNPPHYRGVTILSNGVNFTRAFPNSSDTTTDNSRVVPFHIYGIKGVG